MSDIIAREEAARFKRNQEGAARATLIGDLFLSQRENGFGDGHAQYAILDRLRYLARGKVPQEHAEDSLKLVVSQVIKADFREGVLRRLMTMYRQVVKP